MAGQPMVHVYDLFGAYPSAHAANCRSNNRTELGRNCARPPQSWWPVLRKFHTHANHAKSDDEDHQVPPSINVIKNGDLGFPTYRGGKILQLPHHPHHGAPLLITGCGRRPGGGDAGCRSIVMRRSLDGKTFEPPRVVANASQLVYDGVIPDGIYDGAMVHDAVTNTTFLHWGQCIELCRPGRNDSVRLAHLVCTVWDRTH